MRPTFGAKELVNSHEKIKTGLIDWYGSDIYTQNGTIDRKKLAGIIFTNEIELQKVNNLIHPVVREEFQNWAEKQISPYVIHEAAILFESGFYKMMDQTILVTAPEEMRIERVFNARRIDAKEVRERIQKQWSDDKKRPLATFEIRNDNKTLLMPQIIKLINN